MSQNRLATASEPAVRLPQPPAPGITPQGFVVCPVNAAPWQHLLYQHALEQAQAAARPSLPERDLAGVWN